MSYFWHMFPRGICKYSSGAENTSAGRVWGWREKKAYRILVTARRLPVTKAVAQASLAGRTLAFSSTLPWNHENDSRGLSRCKGPGQKEWEKKATAAKRWQQLFRRWKTESLSTCIMRNSLEANWRVLQDFGKAQDSRVRGRTVGFLSKFIEGVARPQVPPLPHLISTMNETRDVLSEELKSWRLGTAGMSGTAESGQEIGVVLSGKTDLPARRKTRDTAPRGSLHRMATSSPSPRGAATRKCQQAYGL